MSNGQNPNVIYEAKFPHGIDVSQLLSQYWALGDIMDNIDLKGFRDGVECVQQILLAMLDSAGVKPDQWVKTG